ncbi:MAG: phage antirepressor protein [Gammaproteobacteria bacterium RIFCSPLOWO2_02_FULL_42_14]|nr:MAG: phage antirepressor protein [Gammaproteobacteria bacterium RIFCSPHIGHO2_02_FULL_42_43]OGT28466.1 MAG: phage antirepressor protein [Gammaproteobacteria bacterium RIFCSPHIGHO2_01_FULL_42_8]OGT52779.1 MAG: phage antirepressor protein [Gammaproteobacteria bacterium RIFCSPHIGHO2_12_FULL_41_25]OGT63314.1 MAG: phage antirepressor protein [Gammaproteobacteria bacterium RIFCSPLOWO2_02_FULL_42_14]OGT86902.1 MAG: phage antirepressor protein [Gammaproteobacteria bacterium RIFCSPLOWO2_12_FULL_42_18]
MGKETAIVLFKEKTIRRIWRNNEWFFSVVDICAALTESVDSGAYWRKLKQRLIAESDQPVTFCHGLKLQALDGKLRETDCANTEGIFRIIQSIPSPKAEPFKRWLAKVGYERIQEIENPELAAERMREIYKQKGYSDAWIEKRVRGIAVRDELTDEWKKRGVREQKEYAILTAEISKATFGMTPIEYKKFKMLQNPQDNLRDHMTDLELIFTMLGEASTTAIARKKDSQGFQENKTSAKEGGVIAGDARQALEKATGDKIVTKENYKLISEKQIKNKLKDKIKI